MSNERTNLLPEERRHALRRDYFLRIGTVAMIFCVALTLAAAVLLLPTYVFLVKSTQAKKTRLASIESVLSSSDEAAISTQLATLSSDAAILEALANAPSFGATIRAMLDVPHPGITLSGFVYSPATNDYTGTLSVSGVAATRNALRSYQLTIQNASFAHSADLPVSSYAKDTDIAFTIAITLKP
ncbi:MAG: hypothetical protein NTU85_00305 [Candidatus Kaiserbacteria bacterium]|nr:hypothetical protein [Candidatus Kaiserbacteria bacterium]